MVAEKAWWAFAFRVNCSPWVGDGVTSRVTPDHHDWEHVTEEGEAGALVDCGHDGGCGRGVSGQERGGSGELTYCRNVVS